MFSGVFQVLPGRDSFYYDHIIGGLDNGISLGVGWDTLYSIYLSWYLPMLALPLAGLVIVGIAIGNRGLVEVDQTILYLATVFTVVTVATLVAGLKFGSAIHYMNESMIIAVLFLARLVLKEESLRAIRHDRVAGIAASVCALVFLSALVVSQFVSYHSVIFVRDDVGLGDTERVQAISKFIEDDSGGSALVYSPDRLLIALLHDQIVFPQPDLARVVHRRGVVDYSGVSVLMDSGDLRYVVLPEGTRPPTEIYGNEIGEMERLQTLEGYEIYLIR
jgi:hypothetical protein